MYSWGKAAYCCVKHGSIGPLTMHKPGAWVCCNLQCAIPATHSRPENLLFRVTKLHTKTFKVTETWLAKLRSIKVFFDLERLSNFLSDNGVTRAESSEVIFVILLEVVLPTGRGFPDCLISHINHTLFITITSAALCAAVASDLEGNSMKKNVWLD